MKYGTVIKEDLNKILTKFCPSAANGPILKYIYSHNL